ncbi:hypothetical protein ACTM9N_04645 [Lachnospiraceae bacterium HCP1S3_A8]
MIADMHVHSTFSPDGISTMEEQCIAALEKGEINTSSLIDNNDMPMPDFKIIEKYSAIGGTRIVLGSDAHQTERIFNKFETVLEKLPSGMVIGYYENRIFYPLYNV